MSLTSNTLSFKGRIASWDTTADGEAVAQEIAKADQVETLELSSNTLGVDAARAIAKELQNHGELKQALFSDIFTRRLNTEIPTILKTLCDAMLIAGTRLTELDLSDNAIGPQAINGLKEFLSGEGVFNLRVLKLNNCGLGRAGVTVAECLKTAHGIAFRKCKTFKLETFVGGRNRLENPGAIALAKAFKTIRSLEVIEMPQNGITSKGIVALANSFEKNKRLRKINLSDNTFNRNGAIAMSRVIGNLDYLTHVDFGDCLCRRLGSLSISLALAKNIGSIKEISLNGNEIDATTARKIVRMVIGLPGLTKLNIENNNFGEEFSVLLDEFDRSIVFMGDKDDDDGERDDDTDEEPYDEIVDFEEAEVCLPPVTKQTSKPTTPIASFVEPVSAKPLTLFNAPAQAQPFQFKPPSQVFNFGFPSTLPKTDVSQQSVISSLGLEQQSISTETSFLQPSCPSASVTQPQQSAPVVASPLLSFKGRANRQWNTIATGEAIAKEILETPQIHTLEFSTNTLGVEATGPIAAALEKHPELKVAAWSDIFTGRLNTEIPKILKSLCDAMFTAGTRLTVLDLSDNAIGPQAIHGLEGFLSGRGCYALKELRLNNCGLGGAGVIVAECLIQCKTNAVAENVSFNPEVFIAGRNRLEDAGAKAFAKAFQILGSLIEIRMPQNGIRSDGIVALAQGLRKCKSLRILELNDNTFKKHATFVMSRIVKDLKDLRLLNLGDCLCKSEGSIALLKGLADAKSNIQELNLSGNDINASGVYEICKISKRLTSLKSLHLACNGLGSRFKTVQREFPTINFGEESEDEGSISSKDSEDLSDKSLDDDADVDSDTAHMVAGLDINQPSENGFSTPVTSFRIENSFTTAPSTPVNPFITLSQPLHTSASVTQPQQSAPVVASPLLSFKGRANRQWNTIATGEAIAKEILETPQIHTLEFSTNTLGVEATGPIAAALEKHPELKVAAWSDIFTGRLNTEIPKILKSLCDAMFTAGTRLTVLDLSDNAIGPQAIHGLEGFLSGRGCYALKELRLNNCGLGEAGVNVANCLIQCHSNATAHNTSFKLEIFNAGRNRLENRGAKALAAAFAILNSLVEIRLPQNGIRGPGIVDLAHGIARNRSLRLLTLNDNTCGYTGAMALAETVQRLPELRELDISDALCRRRGSVAIVKALANSKIEKIMLNGNELDVPSAQKIVTIAQHELPALTEMVLHTNCFGEKGYFKLVAECTDGRFDFGDKDDDDGERESDTDDE